MTILDWFTVTPEGQRQATETAYSLIPGGLKKYLPSRDPGGAPTSETDIERAKKNAISRIEGADNIKKIITVVGIGAGAALLFYFIRKRR